MYICRTFHLQELFERIHTIRATKVGFTFNRVFTYKLVGQRVKWLTIAHTWWHTTLLVVNSSSPLVVHSQGAKVISYFTYELQIYSYPSKPTLVALIVCMRSNTSYKRNVLQIYILYRTTLQLMGNSLSFTQAQRRIFEFLPFWIQ